MENIFNTNALLISFGPVLIINAFLLLSLAYYWLSGKNKTEGNAEGAKRYRSKFLSSFLKSWWIWNVDPIARLFVKLKIGPNLLTFFGFVLSLFAGILFAKGLFGYAGWAVIFGATFDIFDGYVARLTGKSCRSGAYFDSVVDRFGEGAAFIGLAYYFRDSWILFFVLAGLLGSMMVSYTRARGEGEGVVCKKGSMQRPERIVYMGVSAVLTPVATLILSAWWNNPSPILVIIAQIIIALGTLGTSVYRIIYIMNELDLADKKGSQSLPQIITKLSNAEGRRDFINKAKFGYDRKNSKFATVVNLFVDGLSKELFDQAMKKGDLKNIRALSQNGSISTGTSSFPAVPGISSAPVVTGCSLGACNIPGLRWFDRTVAEEKVITLNRFRDYSGWGNYAMDHDLSDDVQTIFEYSRQAVNIFGPLNRGCGLIRDPGFLRWHSLYKRAQEEGDFELLTEAGSRWFKTALEKNPDFIFYYYPNLSFALERGANQDEIFQILIELDNLTGWMQKELSEQSGDKGFAMFVIGGYGFTKREKRFDLIEFLEQRMNTFRYPGRARAWVESKSVPMISGSSMCHIYLKGESGWRQNCHAEEIERTGLMADILKNDGIESVAARGSEEIIFLSKNSKKQPAPSQLKQIFGSPRCGDLVVIADSNCDLRSEEDSTSNYLTGSLDDKHLTVPIVANHKLPETMTTQEIFSMNMDFLGIEARHLNEIE